MIALRSSGRSWALGASSAPPRPPGERAMSAKTTIVTPSNVGIISRTRRIRYVVIAWGRKALLRVFLHPFRDEPRNGVGPGIDHVQPDLGLLDVVNAICDEHEILPLQEERVRLV